MSSSLLQRQTYQPRLASTLLLPWGGCCQWLRHRQGLPSLLFSRSSSAISGVWAVSHWFVCVSGTEYSMLLGNQWNKAQKTTVSTSREDKAHSSPSPVSSENHYSISFQLDFWASLILFLLRRDLIQYPLKPPTAWLCWGMGARSSRGPAASIQLKRVSLRVSSLRRNLRRLACQQQPWNRSCDGVKANLGPWNEVPMSLLTTLIQSSATPSPTLRKQPVTGQPCKHQTLSLLGKGVENTIG